MTEAVLTDQGGPFTHLDELVRFANAHIPSSTSDSPRLLDLRCGTGALIRAFAPHGWEAVGVDASINLTDAAAKLQPPSMSADFLVAGQPEEIDLRSGQFALIVGLDDLAGELLDNKEFETFLQLTHRLLAPGGHLIFQLERTTAFSSIKATIEMILKIGFESAWRASPGRLSEAIPADVEHGGTRDIFVARRGDL